METKPGYIKYRIKDLQKFIYTTGIATDYNYIWIEENAFHGAGRHKQYTCHTYDVGRGYMFDSDWFKLDLFDNVADKLDLI